MLSVTFLYDFQGSSHGGQWRAGHLALSFKAHHWRAIYALALSCLKIAKSHKISQISIKLSTSQKKVPQIPPGTKNSLAITPIILIIEMTYLMVLVSKLFIAELILPPSLPLFYVQKYQNKHDNMLHFTFKLTHQIQIRYKIACWQVGLVVLLCEGLADACFTVKHQWKLSGAPWNISKNPLEKNMS